MVLAQVPPWVVSLLLVAFLGVCILLILTVLIQRPAGGGLSGAFGSGAGSGQTAFGAKTGDALTIATIAIFLVYLLVAVGLNYAAKPTRPPAEPQAITSSAPPEPGPAPVPPGGAPPAERALPISPPEQPEPEAPVPPEPAGDEPDAPADGGEPEPAEPAEPR